MGGSGGDQETRMDWEERRVMVCDCGALGAAVGGKRKIEGGGGEEKQKSERKKKVKKKRVYNKLTV